MIFFPILIIFELLLLIVQQISLSHKFSVAVFVVVVVVVSHAIHLLRWLCVVVGVDLFVLLLVKKLYDFNFIGENVKIVLWSRSSIPNGCKSAGVADDNDDDVSIKFLHIFIFIFLLSESEKWGTNINFTELHLYFLHSLLSRLNFLLLSLSRFHFTFLTFSLFFGDVQNEFSVFFPSQVPSSYSSGFSDIFLFFDSIKFSISFSAKNNQI